MGAAGLHLVDGVLGVLGRKLGQDAVGCLDEVQLEVLELDVAVGLEQLVAQVNDLCKALAAREAAAHNDEGEQALAARVASGEAVCDGEVLDHLVADVDRFLGGLEADGVVCDARRGEGLGNGAQGDDELVVLEVPHVVALLDGDLLVDGVDDLGLGLDHVGLLEVAAQRHLDVARLDGTAGDLRQEGLIAHVGADIDDGDLGLAVLELLFKALGNVIAGKAAAQDQDLLHLVVPPRTNKKPACADRWSVRLFRLRFKRELAY